MIQTFFPSVLIICSERVHQTMNLLVDVQGFTDYEGNFLPKEVAVLTSGYECLGHWIVKPSTHFHQLSEDFKRINNWMTINHHGIEWHEGDTSLNSLHHFLRTLAAPCETIYTRGRDIAAYLQAVMAREVVDLGRNRWCPSYCNIEGSEKTLCHLHMIKHKSSATSKQYVCALNNVYKLRSVLDSGILEIKGTDEVDILQ